MSRRNEETFQGYTKRDPKVSYIDVKRAERRADVLASQDPQCIWYQKTLRYLLDPETDNDFLEIKPVEVVVL